ncbi:MAG: Gfo/Idh/MocA family oxidoreductase [Candidatus Latescibacteria bacterium]|nr:Gfo/Idh/MocA family oxidoreductase [Candidatus Latescibacterota bacterium]
MDRIRLALVGCGGMAKAHLDAYQTLRQRGVAWFEIVAVCDPVEGSARAFARQTGEFQETPATVYTDLDAMLARERLHCIDTASPHYLHHTIAIACMEAGLDVMVEKPLGVTMKAARLMCACAERTKRILATAEQVRRWLGPRAVKWALDQGLIGRPQFFFMHSSGGVSTRSPDATEPVGTFTWRHDKLTGGGGGVFDAGVHHADLLLYLFGEVEAVYAFTGTVNPVPLRKPDGSLTVATIEDTTVAHLTFANGVVGTWTWPGSRGHRISYLVYYGSHGSIFSEQGYPLMPRLERWNGEVIEPDNLKRMYIDSLDAETRERLFPRVVVEDPVTAEGDYGVALECYDYLCAVRDRRPPELDGWAGLRAQAIPEGFFESSHLRQAVRIEDVVNGTVDGYQREINERLGL